MIENHMAFTGHRPETLPFGENEYDPDFLALKDMLTGTILMAIDQGADTFYCGMAQGIDIICGELVVDLRRDHPDIRLVCVLPYQSHGQRWTYRWRDRHSALLSVADHIVCLSDHYDRNTYYRRNRYLVDHAGTLLAVYDGRETGGTAYTVRYARKQKRTVIRLHPLLIE